jgi:hypothetical protein
LIVYRTEPPDLGGRNPKEVLMPERKKKGGRNKSKKVPGDEGSSTGPASPVRDQQSRSTSSDH